MARDEILNVVTEVFKKLPLAEVTQRLERVGLPYATINRPEDLLDDEHLLASEGLLDIDLDNGKMAKLPALPIEFSEQKFGLRSSIPGIGEHTSDVLSEIGYSTDQINALRASGVLGDL